MHFNFFQWAALGFCAIVIGLSKTGVNGAATIAVPILALIFGARESTGMILPMLCAADLLAVIYYRRSAAWNYILRLLPWALAGFAAALFVDSLVPAKYFRVLIGICIALGLAVMLWSDLKQKRGAPPASEDSVPKARLPRFLAQAFFGVAGGFSTMIGNAAGPVMSVFLLSMRLPKAVFVGTAAWFFMIINYLKIPVQIFAWHNISLQSLRIAALMLPCLILGAALGVILVKKISERYYRILVYVMTLISTALLFV